MSVAETMTREKILETALRYLLKEGVDVSSASTFTNYDGTIRVCTREPIPQNMLSNLEKDGIAVYERNKSKYTFLYNPNLVEQ